MSHLSVRTDTLCADEYEFCASVLTINVISSIYFRERTGEEGVFFFKRPWLNFKVDFSDARKQLVMRG